MAPKRSLKESQVGRFLDCFSIDIIFDRLLVLEIDLQAGFKQVHLLIICNRVKDNRMVLYTIAALRSNIVFN